MKKNVVSKIFIFLILAFSLRAELPSMSYVTSSSIYARSMSMGSAFTAMDAGLENILFNPAAMGPVDADRKNFSFYVDPVAATSAVQQRSVLSIRPDKLPTDWLGVAGLFARAVSFSKPVFQFSILLSEELPFNPQHTAGDEIVSSRGHLDWNYHAAAARLTLAKQVSLGATGYAFQMLTPDNELKRTFGSSYGILMRPGDKLSAGVSYFTFPDQVDSLMFSYHRITSNSINVGVVYRPHLTIRLALDFRNASDGGSDTSNELHAGLEVTPTRFFALRSGYYRQNENQTDIFSAGFGFADFRTYASQTERFVFSNIILNYGLQAEKVMSEYALVHYLTFLVRF